MLLLFREDKAGGLVARRPRIRDRVMARVRANQLDRKLAAGVPPESAPALALRAGQLVSPRTRRDLARSLEILVSAGQWPRSPRPPVPIYRQRIVRAAADLDELACRLRWPLPLPARGIAQVSVLLSDGSGPLYLGGSADDLHLALVEAIYQLGPAIP